MATTTTNHQPTGQPSPPANVMLRLFCKAVFLFCTFLIVLAVMIYLLVPNSYKIFVHPHPRPPITNLFSFTASTLSNTTPATWNLSISLSNPNPKSSIYYNHFNVSLYYSNNISNNSNIVFVGGNDLGNFIQPVEGYDMLFTNVSFSARNLGKKDTVERFMKDQKKGSVNVTVMASYFMNFKKDGDRKMKNIRCDGVMIYFDKSSANETGLGTAGDLPRGFQFYNP